MTRSTWRWIASASSLVGALLGAGACVDLFHSTDFDTLCTLDAAACVPEASADASESDARVEASAPIDFCTYTAGEARTNATRTCAWLGACLGTVEESAFGACMIRAQAAYSCTLNPSLRPQGVAAVLWSCLANVRSCADVSRCVYGKTNAECTPQAAGTFTACSLDQPSTTLIECGNAAAPLSAEPCVVEGRTCVRVDEGKAVCAGKNGFECTGSSRCDGTFAVSCKTGSIKTDIGIDCALFGSGRCETDLAGASCAPVEDAESCTEDSKVICDDAGTARSCVGGKSVVIRCGELSQPCSAGASAIDPLGACTNRDAGTQCTSRIDECGDGGVLRSCAQGGVFEVDCKAVGLGRCTKPDRGASAPATCAKP